MNAGMISEFELFCFRLAHLQLIYSLYALKPAIGAPRVEHQGPRFMER